MADVFLAITNKIIINFCLLENGQETISPSIMVPYFLIIFINIIISIIINTYNTNTIINTYNI